MLYFSPPYETEEWFRRKAFAIFISDASHPSRLAGADGVVHSGAHIRGWGECDTSTFVKVPNVGPEIGLDGESCPVSIQKQKVIIILGRDFDLKNALYYF